MFCKRSIISWLLGSFFKNPANTSGLLATIMVAALMWMYLNKLEVPNALENFVALILGFYFGGAISRKFDPEDE